MNKRIKKKKFIKHIIELNDYDYARAFYRIYNLKRQLYQINKDIVKLR